MAESLAETIGRAWDRVVGTPRGSTTSQAPTPRGAQPAKGAPAPAASISSWSDLLAAAGFTTPRRTDAEPQPRSAARLEQELAELRAKLLAQQSLIDGWTRFTRDMLFAALIARREENYRAALTRALTTKAGELDSIRTLEVEHVRLPTESAWTPSLALIKHEGEFVTRWAIEWRPPAEQGSALIRVDGSKFGRTFSVQATVSELSLSGAIRVEIVQGRGERGEIDVSFVRAPAIDFKLTVAGSWLGSPLKPILAHLVARYLASNAVEPKRISRSMPGLPVAPPPSPPAAPATGAAGGSGSAAAAPPSSPQAGKFSKTALAAAADPSLLALLERQQQPGGLWTLDSRLAAALGSSLRELQARMPAELEAAMLAEGTDADSPPAKCWASALVLATLRLRHHDAVHAWQARVAQAELLPTPIQRAAMQAVIELGLDRPPQG